MENLKEKQPVTLNAKCNAIIKSKLLFNFLKLCEQVNLVFFPMNE